MAMRSVAVVSLTMLLSVGMTACGESTPAPQSVQVARGTVASTVSASGALAPVTSQNIGFDAGGQLVEVAVKVGDRVEPGQLLARIDDQPARDRLRQRQAELDQALADLAEVVNGNETDATGQAENQTRDTYRAVKREADTTNDGNDRAVHHAQAQLARDKAALDAASAAHRNACGDTSTGTADDPAGRQPGESGLLGKVTGNQGGLMDQLPGCDEARAAYLDAKQTHMASRASHDAAVTKRDADHATQRVAVEKEQLALVDARNAEELAGTDREADIAAAEGAVEAARAQLATARRELENTVLYAPVAGTVSSVQGVVGEHVFDAGDPSALATSALAPGSRAAIPGVGAAATSDSAGSADSGLSATRPGGNAFVVLNDINTFQVVVPFEESDAAEVSPGQKVDVTFDAVPGLVREGSVLSIAPGGVAISGVTNYYATILLNESDPRLKAGQTAEAAVRTSSRENVPVVPNAAVIKHGERTFVNVPGPDGQAQLVPFQAGQAGDDNTEVLSGLREGQPVLLPQSQVTQGAPGPR